MERGIERAFLDPQEFIGSALNVENDSVAMQRTCLRECFQHEQIQRSLQVILCH